MDNPLEHFSPNELELIAKTQQDLKEFYLKKLEEAEEELSEARVEIIDLKAKISETAKVILDHINDDDYEMSLAGLYAYLTEDKL